MTHWMEVGMMEINLKNASHSHSVLHQLLGLEETLEMSHLPTSHDQENPCLRQSPPEHPLVCALAGLSEALLTVPLVVLLLSDLLHLAESNKNIISDCNKMSGS